MNEPCGMPFSDRTPLWRVLLFAAERVESRMESSLADAGLSLAKLGVLDHLVRAGAPLPLSKLAARLSCVKSNITQLVDRMEADGLVVRTDDPEDRRTVLATITNTGRARYDAGVRALVEQEQQFLSGIRKDEQEQLTGLLLRLGSH